MKLEFRRIAMILSLVILFSTIICIAEKNYSGVINGHEWVDLGLPSGVKWATCNVGASSPEETGDYFAWGEIKSKSEYTEANSKTFGVEMGDIKEDKSFDVAKAKWGGSWRMPTDMEIFELRKKCIYEWTTQNGCFGMKFTSKTNGKSIFLPAAGYYEGKSIIDAGSVGAYWTSKPFEMNFTTSYYLLFNSEKCSNKRFNRYCGLCIRPVSY